MSRLAKAVTATSICVLLAACGGGGGSDTASPPLQNSNTGNNNTNNTENNNGIPAYAYDSTARFNQPGEIFIDHAGNLYVGDEGNKSIRKIAPSGEVSSLPGTYDKGFTVDKSGNIYTFESYTSPTGYPDRDRIDIYQTSPEGSKKFVYGYTLEPGTTMPIFMHADIPGKLHVLARYRNRAWVHELDLNSPPPGTLWGNGDLVNPNSSRLVHHLTDMYNSPIHDFAFDPQGNLVIGYQYRTYNEVRIQSVPVAAQPGDDFSEGVTALSIPLHNTVNLGYDPSGNLLVMDHIVNYVYGNAGTSSNVTVVTSDYRLRKIGSDGHITTLLDNLPEGGDIPSSTPATLTDMVADASGNIYVTDSRQHAIYKVTPSGQVSLFAGKPDESGNSD